MKVGIVGLGLIGGSLAKGYKRAGVEVFGLDKDILSTRVRARRLNRRARTL